MIALALRLLLAAVCLVAVVGKLAGRDGVRSFRRSLAGVGVPHRLVGPVGVAVVGAELAVVVLAPWSATAVAGTLVGVALFGVLTVGVARAVRAGTTATCRCFGTNGGRLGRAHVARNATLTVAAVVAVAATLFSGGPVGHPAGMVLAVGVAAIGTLVIVYWEDIAAVVPIER